MPSHFTLTKQIWHPRLGPRQQRGSLRARPGDSRDSRRKAGATGAPVDRPQPSYAYHVWLLPSVWFLPSLCHPCPGHTRVLLWTPHHSPKELSTSKVPGTAQVRGPCLPGKSTNHQASGPLLLFSNSRLLMSTDCVPGTGGSLICWGLGKGTPRPAAGTMGA